MLLVHPFSSTGSPRRCLPRPSRTCRSIAAARNPVGFTKKKKPKSSRFRPQIVSISVSESDHDVVDDLWPCLLWHHSSSETASPTAKFTHGYGGAQAKPKRVRHHGRDDGATPEAPAARRPAERTGPALGGDGDPQLVRDRRPERAAPPSPAPEQRHTAALGQLRPRLPPERRRLPPPHRPDDDARCAGRTRFSSATGLQGRA